MPKANPHRLKSGEIVWRVQYRIDTPAGRRVVTDQFKTQKGGDEYGRLIERVGGAAARGVLTKRRTSESETPTLEQWTATYLDPDSGILTGIQPGTRKGYERMSKAFLPILGEHPIDTITRDDIGRWVQWQEKQPSGSRPGQTIAPKTVANYRALLSNIFAEAKKRKLIDDNPVAGVRITRGQSREGVFLTDDEFRRVFEQIPNHYKPLIMFMAYTGCRWGEATALTWGDIDLSKADPTASINKAWKKGVDGVPVLGVPKSAMGRRTVPLNDKVVEWLPKRLAPDVLVYRGVEGGRLWYGMFNTRIWKRAVERSKIGKSPNIHDLRHTYASWLLADGAPLNVVQAKLGHEKIDTTISVYGHLAPGADADIVRVLNARAAALPSPVLEIEA